MIQWIYFDVKKTTYTQYYNILYFIVSDKFNRICHIIVPIHVGTPIFVRIF